MKLMAPGRGRKVSHLTDPMGGSIDERYIYLHRMVDFYGKCIPWKSKTTKIIVHNFG